MHELLVARDEGMKHDVSSVWLLESTLQHQQVLDCTDSLGPQLHLQGRQQGTRAGSCGR